MDMLDTALIDTMFDELEHAPPPMQPSKLWEELNIKNLDQLKQRGLKNFRNTVALNYFTFMGDRAQFRFLKAHLPRWIYYASKLKAHYIDKSPLKQLYFKKLGLPKEFMKIHTYYTHMLYAFLKRKDSKGLRYKLKESSLGTPPPIYHFGKLISADLSNSLLEYYAITSAVESPEAIKNIAELGAGYGRNASLFLQLHKNIKYIVIDIPPALYVSQAYLAKRFPERKVFRFRPFCTFKEIETEWMEAEICFLLPHQIKLLPNKSIDLFLNISSFQEMRLDQITYYFTEIDRLVCGYFYSKQWKNSYIPQEKERILQQDYPVLPHWETVYERECEVQIDFFEALYHI